MTKPEPSPEPSEPRPDSPAADPDPGQPEIRPTHPYPVEDLPGERVMGLADAVERPVHAYAHPNEDSPGERATALAEAVGRRKQATVRVRLIAGTGEFKLNGRALESYFPNRVHQQLVNEPFVVLARTGQYDVLARLRGGGTSGQAGALRLAIARALIDVDPDDRPALKKAGFLTRDARVKERKKYGLKKARKAPQYSKR